MVEIGRCGWSASCLAPSVASGNHFDSFELKLQRRATPAGILQSGADFFLPSIETPLKAPAHTEKPTSLQASRGNRRCPPHSLEISLRLPKKPAIGATPECCRGCTRQCLPLARCSAAFSRTPSRRCEVAASFTYLARAVIAFCFPRLYVDERPNSHNGILLPYVHYLAAATRDALSPVARLIRL